MSDPKDSGSDEGSHIFPSFEQMVQEAVNIEAHALSLAQADYSASTRGDYSHIKEADERLCQTTFFEAVSVAKSLEIPGGSLALTFNVPKFKLGKKQATQDEVVTKLKDFGKDPIKPQSPPTPPNKNSLIKPQSTPLADETKEMPKEQPQSPPTPPNKNSLIKPQSTPLADETKDISSHSLKESKIDPNLPEHPEIKPGVSGQESNSQQTISTDTNASTPPTHEQDHSFPDLQKHIKQKHLSADNQRQDGLSTPPPHTPPSQNNPQQPPIPIKNQVSPSTNTLNTKPSASKSKEQKKELPPTTPEQRAEQNKATKEKKGGLLSSITSIFSKGKKDQKKILIEPKNQQSSPQLKSTESTEQKTDEQDQASSFPTLEKTNSKNEKKSLFSFLKMKRKEPKENNAQSPKQNQTSAHQPPIPNTPIQQAHTTSVPISPTKDDRQPPAQSPVTGKPIEQKKEKKQLFSFLKKKTGETEKTNTLPATSTPQDPTSPDSSKQSSSKEKTATASTTTHKIDEKKEKKSLFSFLKKKEQPSENKKSDQQKKPLHEHKPEDMKKESKPGLFSKVIGSLSKKNQKPKMQGVDANQPSPPSRSNIQEKQEEQKKKIGIKPKNPATTKPEGSQTSPPSLNITETKSISDKETPKIEEKKESPKIPVQHPSPPKPVSKEIPKDLSPDDMQTSSDKTAPKTDPRSPKASKKTYNWLEKIKTKRDGKKKADVEAEKKDDKIKSPIEQKAKVDRVHKSKFRLNLLKKSLDKISEHKVKVDHDSPKDDKKKAEKPQKAPSPPKNMDKQEEDIKDPLDDMADLADELKTYYKKTQRVFPKKDDGSDKPVSSTTQTQRTKRIRLPKMPKPDYAKFEEIERLKNLEKEEEEKKKEEEEKLNSDSKKDTDKANKAKVDEMNDELLFAYAKDKHKWLYEIYQIGGMTLDEFRTKIALKMSEPDDVLSGGKKSDKKGDKNKSLDKLNKEIDRKFKK